MKDEKLELRARVLDNLIEQHGTMGIADLEEFAETSRKLKPFKCLGCFKIVYSTDNYVLRHGVRTHKDCNDKIEVQAEEARTRILKQKESYAQFKRDVEQGIKQISITISITVHGLKPDIERFDSDIERLARDYNLEPWARVRNPRT